MSSLRIRFASAFLACAFLALLTGPAAFAQASRTWVSGVGDDANPCSRTAPCKTFAGAISKTAASGVISVLDPGGYGAVTITKAITIEGDGTNASILAAGTNGIVVNAGVNDVVVIRNVRIEGVGSGLNGIRFLAGKALHVENCTINNFSSVSTNAGIDFQPSGAAQLYVLDTIVRNSNSTNGGAILVKPTVTGSATATLDNVRIDNNRFGIRVEDRSKVVIRNSVISNSIPNNGLLVITSAQAADASVESSVFSHNDTAIKATNALSTIRLSNTTVVSNTVGLQSVSGGAIISFGNNKNDGNTNPGAPTSTVGQQ